MSSEKTVAEQLAEVCEEICDHYCKYPIIYKPVDTDGIDDDYMQSMFERRCSKCPLHRLV